MFEHVPYTGFPGTRPAQPTSPIFTSRLTYGRLFARVFAQRTGKALVLATVMIAALLIVNDILGFAKNLFSFKFLAALFVNAIAICVLVLVRIRMFTKKSTSLLNEQGIFLLLASLFVSSTHVITYLSLYKPSVIVPFFWPEGRYGPPLLREQFLSSLVFCLVSGVFGFLWLSSCSNDELFKERRLAVEESVRQSAIFTAQRLPAAIFAILSGYTVTMAVTGPFLLRLSRIILRQFIPIRPTFHSLRSCLELGSIFHYIWAICILCVIYETALLSIRLLFSTSFRISRLAPNGKSISLLLDGLQNDQQFLIQSQALHELYQTLISDPAARGKLFSEFIEADLPASRAISVWLVKSLNKFNGLLKEDLAILKSIAKATGPADRRPVESTPTSRHLFAKKKESQVAKLFKRLFPLSQESDSAPASLENLPQKNAIPDILSLKPSSITAHFEEKPLNDGDVDAKNTWISENCKTLCEFTAGRYIVGFTAQYYRSRNVLQDAITPLWIIQSIARLAAVAFEEDNLGQVQFSIDQMLSVLLATLNTLLQLCNTTIDTRIPEISIVETGDEAIERLLHEISAAIEAITAVYETSLDSLLTRETRQSLEAYNRLAQSERQ